MAERKVYDVFISYSRKDYVDDQKNVIPGNEVSKIKDALKLAGITYWFDEEGIYSGQNFVERIITNIDNAKIFVFLSTANANSSPWTCKEIASADEFRKHIIPVRIDASPYNKKVLFRIADLDYIEYYTNPAKGIEDLIKSINAYLSELASEERRRKEEENKKEEERRRQKEQEEKRLHETQARLVSEIKLSCTVLNNEEAKLELDRANLLLKAERIIDSTQRDAIITLIKTSGPIHKKYEQDYAELAKERERLAAINSDIRDKDNKILLLEKELSQSKAIISYLQEENSNLSEQISFAKQDKQKQQQGASAPKTHLGKNKMIHTYIITPTKEMAQHQLQILSTDIKKVQNYLQNHIDSEKRTIGSNQDKNPRLPYKKLDRYKLVEAILDCCRTKGSIFEVDTLASIGFNESKFRRIMKETYGLAFDANELKYCKTVKILKLYIAQKANIKIH